jgi:hypothetical protein
MQNRFPVRTVMLNDVLLFVVILIFLLIENLLFDKKAVSLQGNLAD